MEEIKSELEKIDWNSPEVTTNELVLKTIVEQLLLLVVEETNEIIDLRRTLVNMQKKSKKVNCSRTNDEIVSVEPSGVDYQKILMELAQKVRGIQQLAQQMKEEREAAKVQNQAMTKQLLYEIDFLRGELDRKRNEPDSPYKTPAKSAFKNTTRTTNVVISNQQNDDYNDDNDSSLVSTPKNHTPTPRKQARFVFGNESSDMFQTPERATEASTRKARKEKRFNFKQNMFN